jgi:hypothetical protein
MTAPKPRTVVEVSAPLEHYLIPVPAVGPEVCLTCHGAVYDGYTRCYQCNQAKSNLGNHLCLDAVAFVSLAPVGEQMARDLYTYKKTTVPTNLRNTRTLGLAATLWRWLAKHEQCIASAAGSNGFDAITTVPSTSGRTDEHPLRRLATQLVAGSGDRAQDFLDVFDKTIPSREASSRRFVSSDAVRGLDVLIIDDTWTTGAKMQSASAALKLAGANITAGLAVGRWFGLDYRDNANWLKRNRKPWSWDKCCLE